MNLTRFATVAALCGFFVACGGSKNPEPATAPVPAPAPVKEEKKISLDSQVNRYSYALGMDLGKLTHVDHDVAEHGFVSRLAGYFAADAKEEGIRRGCQGQEGS